MGFLRRTGAWLRNMMRLEQPYWRQRWLNFDQPAGIQITPDTALDVSVVWACVMAITTALASSKWHIFGVEGETRTKLPDDRLFYVLNVRPNPEMTAIALREALSVQALTWGNAYAEITRNARGDVAELWPLFSDRMTPRRYDQGALYYEYQNPDGSKTELAPERVYHLHGPGIAGLMGDNTVARLAKSASLAAAQERYASNYFGNNTIIGGVLKTPGKLHPDDHKRLGKDWQDKFGGPYKSNKTAILEQGMEFVPFKNDAETAQLVASRTFQVEEICRWYGVPPHKVQHLLRATFNNIEHLGIEFVRDALTPWARRFEQEADYKLLPQRAPWRATSLDMAWLTHGDAKSRFEAYQIGRNIGVYSVNDILRKEGENTIGSEGDVRIVPMNMTTLEAMANTPPDALVQKAVADTTGGDASPDTAGSDSGAFNSIARDAVVVLFASVFHRYANRLKAREEDLRRGKKPDPVIASHLAIERERIRPWLIEECANAIALLERLQGARPRDEDIVASASAVERGEDPKNAAVRLLPAGNAVVQGATLTV